MRKDPLWPAGHLPHKGGDDSWDRVATLGRFEVQRPVSLFKGGTTATLPPPCGEGWGGVFMKRET